MAGKKNAYQVAKTGLIGGLFGPAGGHVPAAQAANDQRHQHLPGAHRDSGCGTGVTGKVGIAGIEHDLRIPSSTKLTGHLTRLQEELKSCISGRPLVPSCRLLGEPMQCEVPRTSLWSRSSARMTCSKGAGVDTGPSGNSDKRDVKPCSNSRFEDEDDHLGDFVAHSAHDLPQCKHAWRPSSEQLCMQNRADPKIDLVGWLCLV